MENFETILKNNINYIYTVAYSMGINTTDNHYDDLIQVGRISLFNSYGKYNPDLNIPFMKYAGLNIKYAMIDFIDNLSKMIRIPINQIYSENGIKSIPIVSTEKLVYSNSTSTIGSDFIEYKEDFTEDELDYTFRMKAKLSFGIKQLKETEQKIIKLFYGIDTPNEKKYTCEEIGKMMGCTKQNINIKKNNAIKKLQTLMV